MFKVVMTLPVKKSNGSIQWADLSKVFEIIQRDLDVARQKGVNPAFQVDLNDIRKALEDVGVEDLYAKKYLNLAQVFKPFFEMLGFMVQIHINPDDFWLELS